MWMGIVLQICVEEIDLITPKLHQQLILTILLEVMKNQSLVTEFVLLGLSQNPMIQKVVFILFFSTLKPSGEHANCSDHHWQSCSAGITHVFFSWISCFSWMHVFFPSSHQR